MTFKETFENLPDKDKELAKEATSMGEIQEIAEIENTRLSLDELDAAAGGGGVPWAQCKKYAARCRKYDKSFILRCPMYSEREWDRSAVLLPHKTAFHSVAPGSFLYFDDGDHLTVSFEANPDVPHRLATLSETQRSRPRLCSKNRTLPSSTVG